MQVTFQDRRTSLMEVRGEVGPGGQQPGGDAGSRGPLVGLGGLSALTLFHNGSYVGVDTRELRPEDRAFVVWKSHSV